MQRYAMMHVGYGAAGYEDAVRCSVCDLPIDEWHREPCWTKVRPLMTWRELGAAVVERFVADLRRLGV